MVADVTHRDSVLLATNGVTCVFHLASIISLVGREAFTHAVNVEGTRNMLDVCGGSNDR
jgi:nucleoside-diphosphate-sugar epimerase